MSKKIKQSKQSSEQKVEAAIKTLTVERTPVEVFNVDRWYDSAHVTVNTPYGQSGTVVMNVEQLRSAAFLLTDAADRIESHDDNREDSWL